jgi:hypothetical protein
MDQQLRQALKGLVAGTTYKLEKVWNAFCVSGRCSVQADSSLHFGFHDDFGQNWVKRQPTGSW